MDGGYASPTQTQTFDFSSPELWNSVYVPLLSDDSEYIHLYGSAGSGKSKFAAQKEIVKSFEWIRSNRRTLVVRKVAKTLKDSAYAELKAVIYEWGLDEFFEITKSPLGITNKLTNVTFIFIGLDDVEKVKSISGVDRIWIEEATELVSRNELDQLRLRLRGFEKVQITLSYNPINEFHWLNTEIHQTSAVGHKLVKTTYLDNEKLLAQDPNYGDSIERMKLSNPNYYRVYGQGIWGTKTEGLIYPDYGTQDAIEPQFYGLDWGYNDETALIAGAVVDVFGQPKKDYVIQELLYKKHLTSDGVIAELERLKISKTKPIIADSARPEMIAAVKKAGFNIKPCKKYAGSVLDGINNVKNYRLVVVTGSKNLFIEIQNYIWKSGKDGQLDDEPIDQLNHLMDAMRYGLESQKVQQWHVMRRQSR